MNISNMSAYGLQINLKLLGDIIAFVVTTAKANYAQVEELRKRCIFPLSSTSEAMQRDYGFLYLGELLERYEERFGMTLPDRRAIALSLGYTRDIATPEMFVGSQRADFIQGVRRCAEDDLYLTGALYLIHGGESGAAAIEQISCGKSRISFKAGSAMTMMPPWNGAGKSRAKSRAMRTWAARPWLWGFSKPSRRQRPRPGKPPKRVPGGRLSRQKIVKAQILGRRIFKNTNKEDRKMQKK